MLPIVNPDMTPERNNLPTRWQTVIFRNYRMVPTENIAKVLECTVEDVEREAARMGLRSGSGDPEWIARGFVTILRNNWYLLPYEQLMTLLDYTADKLEFVLAKEDFLAYKLADTPKGSTKPACEKVTYSPLAQSELSETEEIAKLIAEYDTTERVYFDIYRDTSDTEPMYLTSDKGGRRTVHPYLTPCADPFIRDTRTHLPDKILDDYAKYGVNRLLIHGVLSTLSPYPFDPEQSRDYKVRRKNLKDLVYRAGKRGIKIILYFNEPRTVPKDKFEKYGRPELAGRVYDDGVSLCLEVEENRQYFYNAVKDLFEEIPELGGISSTTMGENATHCWSSKKTNCPRCASLSLETGSVTVNNLIQKAIRDAGSNATVDASTWQWNDEMLENGIPKLDESINVGSVSEWGVKINKGGVPFEVQEYSISNPGPSDRTLKIARIAKESGHKASTKIQVSNSWELAVVPYLPLFDLELEHLENVHKAGFGDVSLTWTLGSYPSITFDLVSDYLESPDTFSMDKWYAKHFGKDADKIHDGVSLCCKGFREYPFSGYVAYHSPKNLGVANRWSLTPDNKKSTMTNYTYDDYNYWTKPYGLEIYLSQFDKMIADWARGVEIIEGAANNDVAKELLLFSKVALNHFRADVLHTRYAVCKKNLPESKDEMRAIIEEERVLCKELLLLVPQSTLIGFETANYYFYTERDIIEKLVQLDGLEKELDNM